MDQIGLVEIAILIALAVYAVWLLVFFQFVRPQVMDAFAKRMGIQVRESFDVLGENMYETVGKTSLAKAGLVQVLDLVTILVGTVGVLALLSIPGFLLVESGAPYRWESLLTKTAVSMTSAQIPPMSDDKSAAVITVQNESDAAMQSCQISVDNYTASNGYLTGQSTYFDLAARELQSVDLDLSALNPAPGSYDFVLRLECNNRIKQKIAAKISVEG
jgi:hypothetical protein